MAKSIIRRVSDYIDAVQEKFPEIERKDLERIINWGLRTYHVANRQGFNVRIGSHSGHKWSWSGRRVDIDSDFYQKKVREKERYKYKLDNKEWDGYYYFYRTPKQMSKDYLVDRIAKHGEIFFPSIMLYKSVGECNKCHWGKRYFFRIKYPMDCGYKMFKKNYRTNKYEYLGYGSKAKCHKSVWKGLEHRSESSDNSK